MSEVKPFEIRVAGRELSLEAANCVAVMFRRHCEVDYLAVNLESDKVLRIFNNEEMVRWMAGICVTEAGYEVTTADDEAFADEYGWNPTIVIKQEPSNDEIDYWSEVNTRDLDSEWEKGLDSDI